MHLYAHACGGDVGSAAVECLGGGALISTCSSGSYGDNTTSAGCSTILRSEKSMMWVVRKDFSSLPPVWMYRFAATTLPLKSAQHRTAGPGSVIPAAMVW